MPSTRPSVPRRAWPAGVGAVLLAVALVSGLPSLASPAGAERSAGFHAEVLGRSAWYGSHEIAGVGPVWSLDPAERAPRRSHRYVAAPGADTEALPPVVRRALAWAVATPGATEDPVTAAAVGLVLHDLTGAAYPAGPLDLHRLGPADVDGFDAAAGAVLEVARTLRAEALTRALLEPPFTLTVGWVPAEVSDVDAGPPDGVAATATAGPAEGAPVTATAGDGGDVRVRLVDAAGRGLAGVDVQVLVEHGNGPEGAVAVTTGGGTAVVPLQLLEGTTRVRVAATVPDGLELFVPTRRPASRVVRPAVTRLSSDLEIQAAAASGAVAAGPDATDGTGTDGTGTAGAAGGEPGSDSGAATDPDTGGEPRSDSGAVTERDTGGAAAGGAGGGVAGGPGGDERGGAQADEPPAGGIAAPAPPARVPASVGTTRPALPVTGTGVATLRLALGGIGLLLVGDALRLAAGRPAPVSPRGSRRRGPMVVRR